MKYEKIRTVQREGKYEIIYNLLNDDDSLFCGNLISYMGDSVLDDKEEAALFTNTIFVQASVVTTIDKKYNEDEITRILRDKNYLTSEQSFSEDLEVKK